MASATATLWDNLPQAAADSVPPSVCAYSLPNQVRQTCSALRGNTPHTDNKTRNIAQKQFESTWSGRLICRCSSAAANTPEPIPRFHNQYGPCPVGPGQEQFANSISDDKAQAHCPSGPYQARTGNWHNSIAATGVWTLHSNAIPSKQRANSTRGPEPRLWKSERMAGACTSPFLAMTQNVRPHLLATTPPEGGTPTKDFDGKVA